MRLDIVIPAFNEEHRIDRTLRAYRSGIDEPRARFVVALDSCTDHTADVVRSHAEVDRRVELLEFPRLGKGGVIMESFRRCDADVVGFVDADCATPPSEFLRLVDMTAEADAVIASRAHPASVLPARRSMGRRMNSWAFARVTHVLFGLPYGDTQCGAKVLRRDLAEQVLPLLSSRDFLFDVDLLLTAGRLGYRIIEVPTVWLDQKGSHISTGADAGRMALSSLRLWLHHRVLPVPVPGSPPLSRRAAGSPDHVPSPEQLADGPSAELPHPGCGAGGAVRPYDVAMIAPYPSLDDASARLPSGVAAYTERLSSALAEQGLAVHVLAPEAEGERRRTRAGRVTIERGYRRGPAALPAAAAAAARTGAPLVHIQYETFLYGGPSAAPGLAPALLGLRGAGRGPVVTMHQVVDPTTVDREFTRIHRVAVPHRLARFGLSTLQRSARHLAAATVVHERPFQRVLPGSVVVPIGLDVASPSPPDTTPAEHKRALGLPGDRLTVLCFGFLSPYKGLDVALEAAALAGRSVHLVVAGGSHPRLAGRDPYADELRRRFREVARFVGYVPDADVAAWFRAADVLLLPYPRPFSSSGPLANALGFGTPVLCSRALAECVGAPRDLVVPLHPPDLAARLVELAADPGQLRTLGWATRSLAAGRSWEDVARRHIALYEEVIDAQSTPGRSVRPRQRG